VHNINEPEVTSSATQQRTRVGPWLARVRYFVSMLRIALIATVTALLLGACAGTPVLPDPSGPSVTTYRIPDYLLAARIGTSTTLVYTTTDITPSGDTSITPYATYRFTVIDTAVSIAPQKKALAVQRETTQGGVTIVDTTYHWADASELITFERATDTVGRRRLAAPLAPGTTFPRRTREGTEPTNIYTIVTCVDTVATPVRVFVSCVLIRMQATTSTETQRTQTTDELWLAPGFGIVRQRQTRVVTTTATNQRATSILESSLVAITL